MPHVAVHPIRKTGLSMVRRGSRVTVRDRLRGSEFILSTSLADILGLCDGRRSVESILGMLVSHYAGFDRSELEAGLDLLSGKDLVSFESDESFRGLVCVDLVGFSPEMDVLDNFLTYALSLYMTVLVVDPKGLQPDVRFMLQQSSSTVPDPGDRTGERTVLVQVACEGVRADFDRFDIVMSGERVDSRHKGRHIPLALRDGQDPFLDAHHYAGLLPDPLSPETIGRRIAGAVSPGLPPPRAAAGEKPLTIGMASLNDYDGVYFSIQSVRLFHPEVLDRVEFLIVDNNPGGDVGSRLRELARFLPGVRYVPFSGFTGTSVRDLVFQYAGSDWVLCMDSHVLLAPGALRRLLAYLEGKEKSRDLLQGPLLDDRFDRVCTHMEPVWHKGMYGKWSTDERGLDEDAEPFEIGMQGLGLFACRKQAWPGLNERFRGFGGEEGYLHEKFRRAGGAVLCLPFLKWVHRFDRSEKSYRVAWEDRIRNYLLGFEELGWDTNPVLDYFSGQIEADRVIRVRESLVRDSQVPDALAGPG